MLFTAIFFFGVTRTTLVCLTATNIFDPILSVTSIVSTVFNSQGLALNAYNLEVKAPTGHKSITLPDIFDFKTLETYVPISVFWPRLSVPNNLTPAISSLNRTQRVQ